MTDWTPGPWRIERGAAHDQNRIVGADSVQIHGWIKSVYTPYGTIRNASYSDTVCEIPGSLDLPGPAANARLISAAPDLARACESLLSMLLLGDHCGDIDDAKAIREAEEILNKATGRQ